MSSVSSSSPDSSEPSLAGPAPALFYVEDEDNDVFFLKRALGRAGVTVRLTSVTDGDKAIEYLSGRPPYEARELPRLVLLDLNLPARSGFEVLEWLRQQPGLSALPVVIFSSSGRPEDREKARRLGANDYMLKPASSAQFTALVTDLWTRWLSPEAGRVEPGKDQA